MKYEELLLRITKNDKFKIIQKRYDEHIFGNFQIILLYDNSLRIEILNDRGKIEIYILYRRIFCSYQIPLWFAVNYVENKIHYKNCIFENVFTANEFLFKNINTLDFIVKEKLMKDISRKYRMYK